jgi:hypothetical protein
LYFGFACFFRGSRFGRGHRSVFWASKTLGRPCADLLAAIEEEPGCRVATRNQKLSAIPALALFIGERHREKFGGYRAGARKMHWRQMAPALVGQGKVNVIAGDQRALSPYSPKRPPLSALA